MRIQEEVSGNVRILRLAGEFDALDVPEIAGRLDAASAAGPARVVLNLEKVSFATAALLGCLVEARQRARKGTGNIVVSAPSRFVRRALRVLGLDRALEVYRADEDAIRRLRVHDGDARKSPSPPTTLKVPFAVVRPLSVPPGRLQRGLSA